MGSTKVCMKCGKDIPAEFVYCPFCGADQTKKLCKRCGAVLLGGASYCGICGAKVECDVPEFNAETVCYVSTEEHAEDVVCAHEQDEIVSSQTVISTDEKTESDGISKKNKKQCKRGDFDKTKILSIVKSAIILVFCIMMFALAFCPTMKCVAKESPSITRTSINYLSTVDYIFLMGTTARHYKSETDDVKIQKLQEKVEELRYDMDAESQKNNGDGTKKYNATKRYKQLTRAYYMAYLECSLSMDDESGSVSGTQYTLLGVTSLLYIFFASAMLICSIFNFICTFFGKEKNIEKFVYALPMFMFLALTIVFFNGSYIRYALFSDSLTLLPSGCLITTIVFSALLTAGIIIVDTYKKVKAGFSLKKQMLKIVPIMFILVVCGCMFAPSAKSRLTAEKYTDKKEAYIYDIYPSFTTGSILSKGHKKAWKEITEEFSKEEIFDYYKTAIDQRREFFNSELRSNSFDGSEKNALGYYASNDIISFGLLAQAQPKATAALAFGYYACYIVILLSGAWVCVYLSDTEKYKAASKTLQAFIGILVVIALALSVVTIYVVNATMDTAEITYFSMSVGGGLIAALVTFVAFAVAAGLISGRFNDAPKPEIPPEQEAA